MLVVENKMRVVLDLQACQSGSRFRGIGRYSMSLGNAMARCLLDRGHEVIVVLSGAFPDEERQVRAFLASSVQGLRFATFQIPSKCAAAAASNRWRQQAARLLREHALARLEPDFVHVSTLLADGWGDDAVASIGHIGVHMPTALTHYDLIPLVMADIYMPEGPFRDYYMIKLESVRQVDLLLTISNYSRSEALKWLDFSDSAVVNISSAVNDDFSEHARHKPNVPLTMEKYGIDSGFLLYAPGGFDARKNFDRLFEAYSLLSSQLRKRHRLVIASKLHEGVREGLVWKAGTFGLDVSEIIFTDYVPDEDLVDLYRGCHAYVFPSLHEGFGLPVLEAMSCGAPVIASNCTSIPEALGLDEALFDPYQVTSIAEKLRAVISDEDFRGRLKKHAPIQLEKFSWSRSATIAVDAIERKLSDLKSSGWRVAPASSLPSCDDLLSRLSDMTSLGLPSADDLQVFRSCYEENLKMKSV